MKLYNIEAIKGDKFNLFELYNNDNFLNDTLFLRDFFRTLSNIHERSIGSAKAYFKAFYEYYVNHGGNARYWLEKTIENVVTYPDVVLESWLDSEYKTVLTAKPKPTQKDVMRENMSRIEKRTTSLEVILKEILVPYESYGWSWQSLLKLWKTKKDWYL